MLVSLLLNPFLHRYRALWLKVWRYQLLQAVLTLLFIDSVDVKLRLLLLYQQFASVFATNVHGSVEKLSLRAITWAHVAARGYDARVVKRVLF